MKIEINEHKDKGFLLESLLKQEIRFSKKKLNDREKETFYSELSILLNSGISLIKSLKLITKGKTSSNMNSTINLLFQKIVEGSSISEAMDVTAMFTKYEIKSMEIGEQTGNLSAVTGDLADYYQTKNDRKREIISSITYPIIVIATAGVVLFFMLKYVVPMFEDIFKQNHVELPYLTKLMIIFSKMLIQYGFLIFVILIVGIFFLRILNKNQKFKNFRDHLLLKIPMVGHYIKSIQLSRFTHTMMLLSNARVPVSTALHLSYETILFLPLKKAIKEIDESILKGERLSESFSKQHFFDEKIVSMILVAEETNQVEYIFRKLHSQYARELELAGKKFSNTLNPILTLLIGLIVGTILISMYLPMFRLSSVIG